MNGTGQTIVGVVLLILSASCEYTTHIRQSAQMPTEPDASVDADVPTIQPNSPSMGPIGAPTPARVPDLSVPHAPPKICADNQKLFQCACQTPMYVYAESYCVRPKTTPGTPSVPDRTLLDRLDNHLRKLREECAKALATESNRDWVQHYDDCAPCNCASYPQTK